jgi:riboflavin kinase/FMN adenylyltransferase
MNNLAHDEANFQSATLQGGVIALGNFDGVHRGHQSLIKAAVDEGMRQQIPARVLTFEPHPRSVINPDGPPFRLVSARTKQRLLYDLGIDEVIVLPFNAQLQQLSAYDFVQHLLLEHYGAQHVVAGFDFVFGHERGGTMHHLRSWLSPHNVEVTEVVPFRDAQGEIMSSSRIRKALAAGELATANRILGRPWSIEGMVVQGSGRGRDFGYPTANVALGDYQRPKYGVYAMMARPLGSKSSFAGVANIGVRPTLDGNREWLEFHLFNFGQQIYGQEWEVELHHFLRPEQAFPDIAALQAQIAKDVYQAKTLLANPASSA